MIYALRKLIAFVFLGGMFWFIYQDLDNLDKPWFMHALGLITVVFAFFWLLIPMVVVRLRIHRRRVQNRERYVKWRAEMGDGDPQPRPGRNARLSLEPDEQVYLHEKGTLYATKSAAIGDVSREGRPSDVAFPHFNRSCCRVQRTHCYVTDRRLVFVSKGLFNSIPFAELKSFSDTPGGIVFDVGGDGAEALLAFTFQNPLIAADVLRFARKDAK
ncbi:MAG: hypothetical protein IKF72_14715 [Kiritimatiellae bacterium]|nr:hypothetical protein [Kiritimatiellia bacterium]